MIRILVVDDDAKLCRMIKLNLELTQHFQVLTETDASKAVSVAVRFAPDLILLDVMMPKMDGGELSAAMQAQPQLQGIPIVFLTAAVSKKEVAAARGHIGGLPFIAKPVDVEELTRCILSYLAREATPVGPPAAPSTSAQRVTGPCAQINGYGRGPRFSPIHRAV